MKSEADKPQDQAGSPEAREKGRAGRTSKWKKLMETKACKNPALKPEEVWNLGCQSPPMPFWRPRRPPPSTPRHQAENYSLDCLRGFAVAKV